MSAPRIHTTGSELPTEEQARFAEEMRRQSAHWLLVAERFHPERQKILGTIESLGGSAEPLRARYAELREKALFAHSVYSAQARAYEDMLTAGGPDDPEVHETHRQATEFNTALLARPSDNPDGNNDTGSG